MSKSRSCCWANCPSISIRTPAESDFTARPRLLSSQEVDMIDRTLVKVLCVGGVLLFAACGSENMAKDKSELLRGAGEVFGKYYVALKALQAGPTSPGVIQGDELRSADDCEADLEFWRKQGVDDDDALFSYDFNAHPKAQKNTVPFSEARSICKQFRPLYARYR